MEDGSIRTVGVASLLGGRRGIIVVGASIALLGACCVWFFLGFGKVVMVASWQYAWLGQSWDLVSGG